MSVALFTFSLDILAGMPVPELAGAWAWSDTWNVLPAASILALSLVLVLFTRLLISKLIPGLIARTTTKLNSEIVTTFNRPLQLVIILAGTYLSLKTLNGLPQVVSGNLDTIFIITIILVVAYLISKIVSLILFWYEEKSGPGDGSEASQSMVSFARKSVNFVVFGIAIITILAQLKVEITPLVASLGIAGIAVALAAQQLLSNVFGAISILMDRPYRVGDRIELSSGEKGDVIDIGLRSTRIKTLDNRIIVVPNASISNVQINNYSEPNSNLRYTVRVSIAYHSDVERASQVLIDIVTDMRGVLKDPAPVVYVDELGAYSVNLVMLIWGENFRRDWDIPDRVYRQILKRFPQEGIEIPYPVTTMRYRASESAQ